MHHSPERMHSPRAARRTVRGSGYLDAQLRLGTAQQTRIGGEQSQAAGQQHDLAIEELDQGLQPLDRRRRLEQGLAARQLDLDDPREQVGEDRRIVGDHEVTTAFRSRSSA